MVVGVFLMRVLEVMFFTGMAGSVVVVTVSSIRTLYHSLTDPDRAT
jgi:hypothetical protein